MKKYCVLLAFIAASSLAFGQGYFAPAQTAFKVVNGYTTPIANATITVCAAAASGIPCSPVLTNTIFSNQALTQPLSNPFPTDPFGNYQFAAAPATYTVTITASGFAGYSYQTTIGGSGGGGGGGSTGGPNFSIQYNCSSIFCGNGNWLYSAPPSGSNGLGSVVDGGDMAIGANLNVGGSITQTQSGGWQLNGALLGSTTITVPPSYGFSLGVGSDGQFRCILLAGGSCLNAAQLAGQFRLPYSPISRTAAAAIPTSHNHSSGSQTESPHSTAADGCRFWNIRTIYPCCSRTTRPSAPRSIFSPQPPRSAMPSPSQRLRSMASSAPSRAARESQAQQSLQAMESDSARSMERRTRETLLFRAQPLRAIVTIRGASRLRPG